MASPNDNFQLRDGTDALFRVRGKDISTGQDGSLQTIRHLATPYPVDYGLGGCYQLTVKSGTMAAGLAASSPIYAFRNSSATLLALLRRVRISAWSLTTGFAAGLATVDLYRAITWTAADSGGTEEIIGSVGGKLRIEMASTSAVTIRRSSTATLTAGTRTKDTFRMEEVVRNITTATNTPFLDRVVLWEKLNAEHPLTFAQNQGFVIEATVPATGTWSFAITAEWDEVPLVNY
jgi:hypothetical protein